MPLGPTYTVTITDQHSNQVRQTPITANSFLAALTIAINNQLVQSEIANLLNNQDTMTITVTNP